MASKNKKNQSEEGGRVAPLAQEALYNACNPDDFDFASTEELDDLTEMVGQDRAVDAIEFSVGMDLPGFNAFVLGPPGTGRHSFIRRYLTHRSATEKTASDWCYVNNFAEPRKPIILELPTGWGQKMRRDMEQLLDEAYTTIPAAFESESYRERRKAIEDEFEEKQARHFQDIQQRAHKGGLTLIQTPMGFAFVPVRDSKAVPPSELSKKERKRLDEETDVLSEELEKTLQKIPLLVRDMHEKVHALDREIAMLAVGSLLDDLFEVYSDLPKVVDYLKNVQSDIIDNVNLFLAPPDAVQGGDAIQKILRMDGRSQSESPVKIRYGVNVLVDHSETEGAPVIFEDHPIYPNLVGEIEYLAEMGALFTNFTLIKGGALHRANGGYLVLDAHKVLSEPFAWQGLKQVMKSRLIKIESLGRALSLISTATLEPEPAPLNVKVILIGDRYVHYLLQALDPEFLELFKVSADFDDRMERSEDNNFLFARLLGTIAKREELMQLDRSAVSRIIEESSRHAEHSGKLSAQVRQAADIMREANYWAKKNSNRLVMGNDVQQAIDHRIHRASRLRERLREEILENSVLIDTQGECVGQVNGLAVIGAGDYSFAHPNRITARVSLGAGKVIDIERETKLGGPLHSKGVLILSGFLAGQYVTDVPLSLSASLVLEQTYGVEGDSASSAELYALLSALTGIPLKQSCAVTGSVNQHGDIQAIGGVNEKIEGFFDICNARGLNGEQGVLIPDSNVKNLMLRRPVVEAVESGLFRIYPIKTINQGLEVLMGRPAGERDEAGNYPEGTINYQVRAKLLEMAEKRRTFLSDEDAGGKKENG